MDTKANENDIAGCVECGDPLDQRPSFHCSKCLPPPLPDLVGAFPQEPACESCGEPATGRSLDDVPLCSRGGEALSAEPEHGMGFGLLTEALIEDGLIGPFPSEPAFGSPEAVRQAAETIQRWAMRRPVQQIALVPVPTGNLVRFEDAKGLLEQRDRLQAEVERLRESDRILTHAVNQRTAESLRWSSLAVERKAEIAHLREAVQQAEEQRDALADALELQRRFFEGWGMVREHLGVKGTAALNKLEAVSAEALRKAGR